MVRLQLKRKDKENNCCYSVAVLVAAVVSGFLLLFVSFIFMSPQIMQPPSIRSNMNNQIGHCWLCHRFCSHNHFSNIAIWFSDPKTIEICIPYLQPIAVDDATKACKNCQVVYIMGVKGAMHHGFTPIVEVLAKQQVDPESGWQNLVKSTRYLKWGLFGWWGFPVIPVKQVVEKSCSNNGGKHHLIEWASFPSGHEDNRRFCVHLQHDCS